MARRQRRMGEYWPSRFVRLVAASQCDQQRQFEHSGLNRSMRLAFCRTCTGPVIAVTLLSGCSAAARPADTRPVGIRTSERVISDGASLLLETHGTDRRAPILLWLHGGPGGAERPLFRYFNSHLEERFVVSYWDQRGAGRSYDPHADPHKLTIDQHLADLDVIVDHLRRNLGQQKIGLLGHSWGGALGLLYAKAHPDKVSALVAVAPLVSVLDAQQAQYEFVSGEASRRDDRGTLEQLRRIGSPPHLTAERALAVESLADRYGALFHKQPNKLWVVFRGMLGGLVTPWEIGRFIHANNASLEAMHQELLDLDLRRSVRAVEVPVFFLLGRYDRHVDAAIAARYLDGLSAPRKQLIWFENSAHNVPFEEPQLFNDTVVRLFEMQKVIATPSMAVARDTRDPFLGLKKGRRTYVDFGLSYYIAALVIPRERQDPKEAVCQVDPEWMGCTPLPFLMTSVAECVQASRFARSMRRPRAGRSVT
jgi:proline iminopeptidase